jgi:hypothetical protein
VVHLTISSERYVRPPTLESIFQTGNTHDDVRFLYEYLTAKLYVLHTDLGQWLYTRRVWILKRRLITPKESFTESHSRQLSQVIGRADRTRVSPTLPISYPNLALGETEKCPQK